MPSDTDKDALLRELQAGRRSYHLHGYPHGVVKAKALAWIEELATALREPLGADHACSGYTACADCQREGRARLALGPLLEEQP